MSKRPFDELKSPKTHPPKVDRGSFLQSLMQEFKRKRLQFDGVPILDGQLHYAHDRRDRSGEKKIWYAAHPDKGRATFGHFRDLKKYTWTVEGCLPQTPDELRVLYNEVEAERRLSQQKKSEERVKARAQSLQEWKRATAADVEKHSYVVSKKLRADGLRRQGANLIVPLYDQEGKKAGIQRIDESGEKRFPKGLTSRGLSSVFGSLSGGETIVVCEGVATALSIHEATGLPVVGALSSNNLQSTGVQLRLKYPLRDIVVAGDDDRSATVNVGKLKATRLAKTIEARLAMPTVFHDNFGKDFNDLHVAHGLDAVREAINHAKLVLPPLFAATAQAMEIASDKAHAQRLMREVADNCAFSNGAWYHWGPVWRAGVGEAIEKKVYDLAPIVKKEAESLAAESGALTDPAKSNQALLDAQELRKALKQLESATTASRVVKVAKHLMEVDRARLDHHRYLFAARNGVIDLRDFQFRPHRRRDWLTYTANCDYAPDEACPRWEKFIDQVCRGDAELIDFLQRLLGYIVSGQANEQILVYFHGGGRNGKGTLLEVVQDVLGPYAYSAVEGLLVQKPGERHLTEIMDLAKRRLVVCSELGKNAKLNISRAKQLSGQDRVTARRMHKDSSEFQQTHTFIVQTNDLPNVDEFDKAMRRRTVVVPFLASIKKKDEDNSLREKLKGEASGILNWLIDGLRKYRWYGLCDRPQAVRDATNAYRYAGNAAYAFVQARCERVASDEEAMSSKILYAAYEQWAEKEMRQVVDQNAFGRALSKLGVHASRNSKSRKRRIRLKKRGE